MYSIGIKSFLLFFFQYANSWVMLDNMKFFNMNYVWKY